MPTTALVNRLMLLPAAALPGRAPAAARVRRYRLARVPPGAAPASEPARYAYLKRVHD